MPKRSRISWEVKQSGRGLADLKARLKEQIGGGAIHVKAGALGTAGAERDGGGITNPELLAVHEYGAPEVGIPARPSGTPSFDKNRDKYEGQLRRVCVALVDGPVDVRKALGLIGSGMASDWRNYITQGPPIPPPNAPATLARKQAKTAKGEDGKPVGEVRTLVDTGRMVDSISWAVESGSAGGGE